MATKGLVLYDAIRWTDDEGAVQENLKGDEVSLPTSEFNRLSSFTDRDGNPDPAVGKPGSPEVALFSDEELGAEALMDKHNREELDALASAAGVENPAELENKRAVAEAIVAARG